MKVTFFDYPRRFAVDNAFVKRLVAEVGASGAFILKQHVAELEDAVKRQTGAAHAIAVSSGTDALLIALSSLGVGPGVDVLTPAFSFISTASAPALLRARPVFVDVNPDTGTLAVDELSRHRTPETKVVIAVHLFSSLAPMADVQAAARALGLRVLEDSAVSLGARTAGVPAGLAGDVGIYSFFPAKPLGGIGDGGMIVTHHAPLGDMCRRLRNHGQDGVTRFLHHHLGWNHRMDDIMAAYLKAKLARLPALHARRRAIGEHYDAELGTLGSAVKPLASAPGERVFYTYVIRAQRRDELRAHLLARGVETQLYYPVPLHLQPCFAYLGHVPGDFPGAETLSREALALPLYPEMTDAEVDYVIASVRSFHA
jgi:dTDP-4-amino-4,6-dideoxygalactose transaminase